MTLTSAVLSFAVVAGLLTLVPGLDTALVVRATVVDGRRAGFATALGVGTGCLGWGLAAAAGVATLVAASAPAGTALRVAGVAYLGWLGVRTLWSARRRVASGTGSPTAWGDVQEGSVRRASAAAWFRRGVVTNVLNPKIGAFYVAVIPQFLPPDVPPAVTGVLLALVHDVEGLLWFALVVAGVTRLRRFLARPAARRAVDAVTGTALLGFAVALAREAA